MKRLFCGAVMLTLVWSAVHAGSPELERVKALAGTWKGKTDMGQGEQEMTVTYAVTAAGSAVVETLHPGTPMEMVSVYHDAAGKLTMTDYCMLGNQPRMKLDAATDNSITLSVHDTTGISDANDPHMHALTIEFTNAHAITHHWKMFKAGKEDSVHSFKLTRK